MVDYAQGWQGLQTTPGASALVWIDDGACLGRSAAKSENILTKSAQSAQ
jgi:hypothetical protein